MTLTSRKCLATVTQRRSKWRGNACICRNSSSAPHYTASAMKITFSPIDRLVSVMDQSLRTVWSHHHASRQPVASAIIKAPEHKIKKAIKNA